MRGHCGSKGMRRISQIALVGLLAGLLLGATGDNANRRFDDLGHKLMCRCGCNQVLLECNHVGCEYSDKMRGQLRSAIDRGDSDKVVLASFVEQYGAIVLAAPTTSGFNLVAWIMPFVALALGTVVAAWVVRLWKRRPRPQPAPARAFPPEQLDELRARARQETQL